MKVCSCWQHGQGEDSQYHEMHLCSSGHQLHVRDMGLCFCAGNMGMAEKVYKEVLRQDPDSAASMKSIKRIRLMHTAKDAGNEAFKVGSLRSRTRSLGLRGFLEAEKQGHVTGAHTAREVIKLGSRE